MTNKEELTTWKCDACAEAECTSGLPCTLTSAFLPEKATLHCPISCEECEWEIVPTCTSGKSLIDALEYIADEWEWCECGASKQAKEDIAEFKENFKEAK